MAAGSTGTPELRESCQFVEYLSPSCNDICVLCLQDVKEISKRPSDVKIRIWDVEKRVATRAGDSLQQYLGITLSSLDFRIICKNCNRQVSSALQVKQKKRESFEEGRLRSSNFVRRSVKRLAIQSPNQIVDQKVARKPAKRHRLDFAGGTIQSVGNKNDLIGSLSSAEDNGTNGDTAANVSKRLWMACRLSCLDGCHLRSLSHDLFTCLQIYLVTFNFPS